LKLGKSTFSFLLAPSRFQNLLLSSRVFPRLTLLVLLVESKFIIFKLSADLKEIVVDTVSQSADYEEFISGLPETGCRWAVYDFEYEKGNDGKRNKLCFYAWSVQARRYFEEVW
jgi:cofilin